MKKNYSNWILALFYFLISSIIYNICNYILNFVFLNLFENSVIIKIFAILIPITSICLSIFICTKYFNKTFVIFDKKIMIKRSLLLLIIYTVIIWFTTKSTSLWLIPIIGPMIVFFGRYLLIISIDSIDFIQLFYYALFPIPNRVPITTTEAAPYFFYGVFMIAVILFLYYYMSLKYLKNTEQI